MVYVSVLVILAGIYLIDSGIKNRAPIGFLLALISSENPDFQKTLKEFNGKWTEPIDSGPDAPTIPRAGEKGPDKVGLGSEFSERNGKLLNAELKSLSWTGAQLAIAAVPSFESLNRAFKAEFKRNIFVTDGYRTFAEQVITKAAKPTLAAEPGTSNHGLGLAVDLGGGINAFNTPEHRWMMANAPKFGWVNPSWAQAGAEKPEPWHWEFTGGLAS